jgi:hypothetical protein
MKRKWRRFTISVELFLQLFTEGPHRAGYRVKENGIPEDAKLVNVRHAWPNSIEVLIESESFGDVGVGEVVPEATPVIEKETPQP